MLPLKLNTRSGMYYVACYRLTHEAEFIRCRRIIVRLISIVGDTKSDFQPNLSGEETHEIKIGHEKNRENQPTAYNK